MEKISKRFEKNPNRRVPQKILTHPPSSSICLCLSVCLSVSVSVSVSPSVPLSLSPSGLLSFSSPGPLCLCLRLRLRVSLPCSHSHTCAKGSGPSHGDRRETRAAVFAVPCRCFRATRKHRHGTAKQCRMPHRGIRHRIMAFIRRGE